MTTMNADGDHIKDFSFISFTFVLSIFPLSDQLQENLHENLFRHFSRALSLSTVYRIKIVQREYDERNFSHSIYFFFCEKSEN